MNSTVDNENAASDAKPTWALNRRERKQAERRAAGLPVKRRRWPWILAGLVVLGSVAFMVISGGRNAPVEEAEDAGPRAMQLNTEEYVTLETATLTRTVKVTGSLEPARKAQLSSQVGGQVQAVNAQPGNFVTEGDVLVQIDVETLSLQLDLQRDTAAATRSQLELAESQLERAITLNDRGISSASDLEQVQTNVDGLRANLRALDGQVALAENSLNNATVRAPFSGVVASSSVEPGQYISVGAPLFNVVDLNIMEMQGSAPVAAGAALKAEQLASISVDGVPDRSFAGTVVRINPVAQEGTRTVPVYITIDNSDGTLRGGMFASGQVTVAERQDAIAVPRDALHEDDQGKYVLKIVDNELVRTPVETGQSWSFNRVIGIVSGLDAGDVIVSAPLDELQPGDLVRTVEF